MFMTAALHGGILDRSIQNRQQTQYSTLFNPQSSNTCYFKIPLRLWSFGSWQLQPWLAVSTSRMLSMSQASSMRQREQERSCPFSWGRQIPTRLHDGFAGLSYRPYLVGNVHDVSIKCRLMPIGFEDFGSVLKLARSATGEKVNGVGLCFVSWRIGFQMCAVGRLWMQRYLCQHRRFPDHWGWESIYFHLLHDVLCPSAEIFTSFAWKTFWKETLLASFVCLLTQKVTVSVLFQGRCICLQCIPLSTGVKQVLAEWERSQVQVPDAMSGFVGTPRQQLVRKHRRPGGSRAVVGGCTDLWSVSMSSAVESFTKCMKLLWQPWTAMSKFTWSLFLRLGEDELSERGKAFFGKPSEENANCNQLS